MKKLLIVSLLLMTSFFYAQEDIKLEIKKSEILKESTKKTSLDFSDSDGEGGVITVKAIHSGMYGIKTKAYVIDHYNADLKLMKSVTLPNEKHTHIEKAFVKNGKLFLIQFVENKKNKSIKYNVLSSSINSLKFDKKEIFSMNREKFKKYFAFAIGFLYYDNGVNQADKDTFGKVTLSKNNNYILISFDVKNKEKESHSFIVFDADFKEVYKSEFHRDIKDKLFDFEDVEVSDKDGTIYFLGKAYENNSKKRKRKKKTNYHFELFKLSKEEQKQVSLKETDKFIKTLHLLHQKDKLSLVGFYSEKDDFRYKGVCRFNLSDDLKILNKSFQPFSNQFFEDKYKKGANVKDKKKELRFLDIKSVFIDDNDNLVLNAEEYYVTTYYSSNQYGGHYVTTYHFDDIVTVKIDSSGKLVWARNINKRQIGFINTSFTAIFVNNKNYIFLNAADKIKELSNNRFSFKQTNAKKSNLYAILIDEKGDLSHKKIIDDKESKVWYKVSDGIVDTKNNSVLFLGSKKKYQRILKIIVE